MSKEHPRPWKAVQSKNGWFISDANDTSVVEAAWVVQDGYCLLDGETAKAIVHSYNKFPEVIETINTLLWGGVEYHELTKTYSCIYCGEDVKAKEDDGPEECTNPDCAWVKAQLFLSEAREVEV